MPRKPRYQQIKDGDSFHAMWQSHNKSFFFEEDIIKRHYYDLLLKYAPKYGVEIHAYTIMSNHPHLFGRIGKTQDFVKFQHIVNLLMAKTINSYFDRLGQVIRDRYKVVCIKNSSQALAVQLYLDMNPVRAGITSHPKLYKWSSFHFYASDKVDPLITPCSSYLSLGNDKLSRRHKYMELIQHALEREKLRRSYLELPKELGWSD